MWSVGSEPGYTDVMSYVKVVVNECGVSDENNPLDLHDGHYYYINVRVSFVQKLTVEDLWCQMNVIDWIYMTTIIPISMLGRVIYRYCQYGCGVIYCKNPLIPQYCNYKSINVQVTIAR